MLGLETHLIKRYLKWPLIFLVIAISVLGSSNWLLNLQKEQLLESERQQKSQLNNLIRQVKFLRVQEQLFLKYGDKYQQLMQYGLVHQQNRVKWVDVLLDIQQTLMMKPFMIQFEPEQKLVRDQLEGFEIKKDIFYYTRLNIQAGLHSDTDLLRLVHRLSAEITPLFMVESCKLSKLPTRRGDAIFVVGKANLLLECAILLLEAKPSPFKGVESAISEE